MHTHTHAPHTMSPLSFVKAKYNMFDANTLCICVCVCVPSHQGGRHKTSSKLKTLRLHSMRMFVNSTKSKSFIIKFVLSENFCYHSNAKIKVFVIYGNVCARARVCVCEYIVLCSGGCCYFLYFVASGIHISLRATQRMSLHTQHRAIKTIRAHSGHIKMKIMILHGPTMKTVHYIVCLHVCRWLPLNRSGPFCSIPHWPSIVCGQCKWPAN